MPRYGNRLQTLGLLVFLAVVLVQWQALVVIYQLRFVQPPLDGSSPMGLLVALRATVSNSDRTELYRFYLSSSREDLIQLDRAAQRLALAEDELAGEVRARFGSREEELLRRSTLDVDSVLRMTDLADLELDYRNGSFVITNVSVALTPDGRFAFVNLASDSPPLRLIYGDARWELVPGAPAPEMDLASIPPSLQRLRGIAESLATAYRDLAFRLRQGESSSDVELHRLYREIMFSAVLRISSTS